MNFINDTFSFELKKGLQGIISMVDLELLINRRWYAHIDHTYGTANTHRIETMVLVAPNKQETRILHRVIMSRVLGRELTSDEHVDHINGNPLDNRRENLRIASPRDNNYNKGLYSNNTSGYKGVSKRGERYTAYIQVDGKKKHLGYFDDPKEAHEAYCAAGRELYGDFFNPGKR